jgi:hypothetical protein
MAAIGTKHRPAVLRVHSQQRAQEVVDYCQASGIHAVVGVEPSLPEDLRDLERALKPPKPVTTA